MNYPTLPFTPNRPRQPFDPYLAVFIIALFLLLWFAVAMVWGSEIMPPNILYKGLIAEAVSEGEIGMTAICFVYKNRLEKGMPLGCVALKRKDLDKFVERQGRRYELMAKSIIQKVFYGDVPDISKGATHYENEMAFGKPYWAKNMVVVARIGSHIFYKEK